MLTDQDSTDIPPISRVIPDILHLIFTFNASRRRESGLNFEQNLETLHRTSQVCQTWRNIILESPSLWGRCINCDCLNQRTDHWRNLVIQRAGKSPLHVSGRMLIGPESGLSNHLVNLLDEEWARICAVDLILHAFILDTARVWNILGRPTRTMKIFSVLMVPGNYVATNIPTNFRIFSNIAPSLTRLSLPSFFRFPLDIIAPVMFTNNLRDLHIDHPLILEDIDLLKACQQMPSLEALNITVSTLIITNRSASGSIRPSMPNLCRIGICTPTLDVYAAFLDLIIPFAGCHLRMKHNPNLWRNIPQETISNSKVETMQRTIKRYADSFFEHCEENLKVQLHVFPTTFQFGVDVVSTSTLLERGVEVMVVARIEVDSLPFCQQLFNMLPTINFPSNKVTHFEFFSFNTPLIETPAMVQIIEKMHSVILLTTSIPIISRIGKLSETDIIFPCIKTLHIRGPPPSSFNEPELLISNFLDFLTRRHKVAPVEVLDLSWQSDIGDFRLLNELAGLKVVCRDGRDPSAPFEYICGTGDGEKLFLLQDSPNSRNQWVN